MYKIIAHRKSLTFAERYCVNDISSAFLYILNLLFREKSAVLRLHFRDFRQYVLVGVMPHVVLAYVDGKNFKACDIAKFAQGYEDNELYCTILFDKLNMNEGVLMENVVAQMLRLHRERLYFYLNAPCFLPIYGMSFLTSDI